MLIHTRFIVRDEPDADFESWFADTVRHPVVLERHASNRNPAFVMSTDYNYTGAQGQTAFDLHALALIWMIGHKFAPKGNTLIWQNALINGTFVNTEGVDLLADSITATAWIRDTVRPGFRALYPGVAF